MTVDQRANAHRPVGRRTVTPLMFGSGTPSYMAAGIRAFSSNSTRNSDADKVVQVPGKEPKVEAKSAAKCKTAERNPMNGSCVKVNPEELDRSETTRILMELFSQDNHFKGVFDLIISPKNLAQAWKETRSKPGGMTPGVDKETLDGLCAKDVINLHTDLKNRSHLYKPLRRINIPKPGKPHESRSLSIAAPRDKIIQQAFKRVIEIIYEGVRHHKRVDEEEFRRTEVQYGKKFTRTKKGEKTFYVAEEKMPTIMNHQSHGFRPSRSCHTAIESIKKL